MTEISQLLKKINQTPSYIENVDWVKETDEFAKKRIAEIIRGIANADLRELAGEYIAEAWYDSCENDSGFFGMQDIVGYNNEYGCEEYEYRFEPRKKKGPSFMFVNHVNTIFIENFIQEQLDFCLRNEERKQKLRRLQLKADRDIAALASYAEVDKESIECLSRYAAESVRKKFKEQDLEECAKQCPKIGKAKQQARTEAIREFVEQIIVYAEKQPTGVAREIKDLLVVKSFNHHISEECLTEELRERINKLGQEKQANIVINSNTTDIRNSSINSFYEGTI